MATRRTSTRDPMSSIAEDVSRLVRQEIETARDEILEKLKVAGVDLGMLGAGGALASVAVLALAAAVVDAIHGGTPARGRGLPVWASAGLTGVLAAGLAGLLAQAALADLRQQDLVPRRVLRSLEETARGAGRGQQRASTPPPATDVSAEQVSK